MSLHPVSMMMAKTILVTITAGSALWTAFLVGPLLETKFLPVLDPLTIVKVEPVDQGSSHVWVHFRKLRPCDYVGTAWFRGIRRGTFEQVVIIPLRTAGDESSPTRPVGMQNAGPWMVAMPADEIRTNSFVDIYHRCHPFWITHTNWYP